MIYKVRIDDCFNKQSTLVYQDIQEMCTHHRALPPLTSDEEQILMMYLTSILLTITKNKLIYPFTIAFTFTFYVEHRIQSHSST